MKQFTTEREREKKKERKKKQNNDQKNEKIKTQRPKKSRERATFFDEHVLRHTFYIFFFSPSLKGERKERRGRFDLHNNAQKHTENTRAREKESVRTTKPHTILHRNESLEEEDKGKRRFVERDFEKFVKQFVEERPLKRRRLDLKFSLFSLSLYIFFCREEI